MDLSLGMGVLLLIGIGLMLVGGRIRRRNLASERSAAALAIRGRKGVDPGDDAGASGEAGTAPQRD